MEIWKQRADGRYGLLKTYSICKWSGALGPKKKEGDRQAPEGFYTVTPAQMNPNSNYYLSFNIGYPNAYDRALGRTGSNLMVHGACSSAGCYSMTDEDAGEIFALARDAFRGGQRAFEIQAFPFRMTPENLAKHRDDPEHGFLADAEGRLRFLRADARAAQGRRLRPALCLQCRRRRRQLRSLGRLPGLHGAAGAAAALERKQAQDDAKFAQAVAMLDQKQQQQAAREQAAAERAANPSFIERMLGAKPKPEAGTAEAPATPVMPPKAQVSAAPERASVPKPKPAPSRAAAAARPAASAPAEKTARRRRWPSMSRGRRRSPARNRRRPTQRRRPRRSRCGRRATPDQSGAGDTGKITAGMTPEIQPGRQVREEEVPVAGRRRRLRRRRQRPAAVRVGFAAGSRRTPSQNHLTIQHRKTPGRSRALEAVCAGAVPSGQAAVAVLVFLAGAAGAGRVARDLAPGGGIVRDRSAPPWRRAGAAA